MARRRNARGIHSEFYDLLEVKQEASDDDIRRSFKRLALKFHPDKTQSLSPADREEAERRFKAINEAYSVLSDPARRDRYDAYGPEDDEDEGEEYYEPYDESGFTAGLEPEDFVSMMLGLPPGARPRRRHYTEPEVGMLEAWMFTLLQLLPALLVLGMALVPPMSSRLGAGPAFKLRKEAPYTLRRTTAGAQTPFYVTPEFEREILRDLGVLHRVEAAVEGSAKALLRENCERERKTQQRMLDAARRQPKGPERDEAVAKAQSPTHTPSCAKYDGFGGKNGGAAAAGTADAGDAGGGAAAAA